jgi:hypothetical protein
LTPRYKSLFTYYGSKSHLAGYYPPPGLDVVIEPFAGSAAYSLRYWHKQVILCDLNRDVVAAWRFLQSPNAGQTIDNLLPAHIEPGMHIDDIVRYDDYGLRKLVESHLVRNVFGTSPHNYATFWAATRWLSFKRRLSYWIPRIQHWQIINDDYQSLPNVKATWFIDPPYSNQLGRYYKHHLIDYSELARWCQSRLGEVIVCENGGANWLPFRPFVLNLSLRNKRRVEAVFFKGFTQVMPWNNGSACVGSITRSLRIPMRMGSFRTARPTFATVHRRILLGKTPVFTGSR